MHLVQLKKKKLLFVITGIVAVVVFLLIMIVNKQNVNPLYEIGQPIDSLNGVVVYYNGGVDHVFERNLTADNYNLGLKYQCVEFVKRYYYEHLDHKMPDSYGHAKSFFNKNYKDGTLNKERNLIQYTNPSLLKPEVDDLIVLDGTLKNRYGHVAIISKVTDREIEIIQQNPGPFGKSRDTLVLLKEDNVWKVDNGRVLGWLRKL